jgi:hypothetical protein
MITGVMRQTMKSMTSTVINEGLHHRHRPDNLYICNHTPRRLSSIASIWGVVSKFRRLGAPKIFWRHPSIPFRPPSDEAIAPPPQFIVAVALPYLYPYLVAVTHSIFLQDSIEFTLKTWFITSPVECMVEMAKELIPVPDDQLLCSTEKYFL